MLVTLLMFMRRGEGTLTSMALEGITNLLKSRDNIVRRAVLYLGKTKHSAERFINELCLVEFQYEFKVR